MQYIYYITIPIVVISLLLIVFIVIYNNIENYLLRLRETSKEIDEELRNKHDILFEENQNIKIEFPNLKEKRLSSFDFHRELIEIEGKVNKLIENKETLENLSYINIRINSYIKYYNDTVTSYNSLIKKFPSNFVSKITKRKVKNYFDGKNLFDSYEKDFKL